MTAFFKREPGPSSVSSPNSSQRFSSSGEIREKWKDPQKKKNAQRQKHLRLLRKSDTQTRKTRFITNLVATQTDADFTSQQGKAEVVSKIMHALGDSGPTKKKRQSSVVDEEGHQRKTQTTGFTPLFRGEIDGSYRRKLSGDEKLIIWDAFKLHHGFSDSSEDTTAAKELALQGGVKCQFASIATRIARENPKQFGDEHPLGPITRNAVRWCVKSVAQGCQEAYVGRKRTLPDVAVALVITTLTCILATKAIIWTIPLLRQMVT